MLPQIIIVEYAQFFLNQIQQRSEEIFCYFFIYFLFDIIIINDD